MSKNNRLKSIFSIYLAVLYSFLTDEELNNGEIIFRDIRPFWSGIDSAFQDMFHFYSSSILLFQKRMEQKYGVSTTAGYESIIESIEKDNPLQLFLRELKFVMDNICIEDSFSIEEPNADLDVHKKAFSLVSYKADFYYSLFQLGKMPGHIVGADSYHRTMIWISGYDYALAHAAGIHNSFNMDFQTYYQKYNRDNGYWKETISENISDQEAFNKFFSLYFSFLYEEKKAYYEYIIRFFSIPPWIRQ